MPKSRLILIAILGVIGVFFLLVFFGILPGLQKNDPKTQITKLTFWGVFDKKANMEKILPAIPGFQATYTEMDPKTYESDLVNALASGTGPDIFMINRSWIPKHSDKLVPLTPKDLNIKSLRDIYPTVVEQDFSPNGYIYALPLWMDTLALFYNKNIFDQKGVVFQPKNWKEFQDAVSKTTEIDKSGRILKSGASIGGSETSVYKASDILSALMLQTGTPMVSADFAHATFSQKGIGSLNFYADFANPKSKYYTWNDSIDYSLDSFAKEKSAMMIGYAYSVDAIKARNPFLKYGISELPVPENSGTRVDYPDYWGVAVSKKTKNALKAWSFIYALASNQQIVKNYTKLNNRLPALRSLLTTKTNDPFWGVFAQSALTARSWPEVDPSQVNEIFSNMISNVITGNSTSQKAIKEAEAKITNLMQNRKKF